MNSQTSLWNVKLNSQLYMLLALKQLQQIRGIRHAKNFLKYDCLSTKRCKIILYTNEIIC